jgi:Protein of unknown function (DUF3570)
MRGLALFLCAVAVAHAETPENLPGGRVDAALHIFSEPAPSQTVVVVTPAVRGRADIKKWISLDVDWTADVVSGATPRTYGTPDAVTAATKFSDVRNSLGARAELRKGPFTGRAGYRFGIENDYRSHALVLGAEVDLFQRSTTLAVDYAHDFDSVCDLDNRGLPPTLRQPLGRSHGCFANTRGLTTESVGIDDLSLTVTQALTPRLIGSLVGTWQRVDGFQSNPYRQVRLDGGTLYAQESHPSLRDRGSVAARLRWAVPRLQRGVLGLDLRYYGDTWGVQSGTIDVSLDKEHLDGKLRWRAHVRYYQQSGAVFYRDAGRANSYENDGPVGRYFTGDRELAPLGDLVVGGLVAYRARAADGKRMGKIFRALELALDVDLVKVFAFTPQPPNHPRMTGVVDALALGLTLTGEF